MVISDILTKNFLIQKYVNEGKTFKDIAQETNIKVCNVAAYIRKLGITRPYKDGPRKYKILTKDFLQKEYVENKKSVCKICIEFNIKSASSISHALKKHGLHIRHYANEKYEEITKELLYTEFIINKKSIQQIGKELQVRPLIISRKLKQFNIKRKFNLTTKFLDSIKKRIKRFGEMPAQLWSRIKGDAKRRFLEFDITPEFAWNLFLQQKRKCAISNLDLKFCEFREKMSETTASLDRIDSNIGYIPTNIQWVHKDINLMKSDLSQSYFIFLCKKISENN